MIYRSLGIFSQLIVKVGFTQGYTLNFGVFSPVCNTYVARIFVLQLNGIKLEGPKIPEVKGIWKSILLNTNSYSTLGVRGGGYQEKGQWVR